MEINSHTIKKLRAEKSWSQEKLSEASGLNLRTVQRIENSGKASQESVRLIANAFGIDTFKLTFIEQEKKMTPIDAVKSEFIEFSNFSGTASRFEYWWFFLFVLLLTAIATIIHNSAYLIVSLIILLPLIAVGTRRLNEINRSGWWQLLALVPFGIFVVFYMLAQEGDEKLGESSLAK